MPRPLLRFAAALLLTVTPMASTGLAQSAPTEDEIARALEMVIPDNPGAIFAVVGQAPIQRSDLMPKVEAQIQDVLAKAKQEVPAEQIKAARIMLLRGLLKQSIQTKMMRESFLLDQVGTENADKRREANEKLSSKARQMFYEEALPKLRKQHRADDLIELDAKLRESGSSLVTREREYVDQMLGHLYIASKVEREPKVSLAEVVEYYQTHRNEFERSARARWEQLSVYFGNFSSRDEAQVAIREMGREAYFGGNMQAVAREKSQDPFAPVGGLHEWTSQGALASKRLDAAIFSIPVDAMSEIIEDDKGLHIVRVLEREQAGIEPLGDVQEAISKKLRDQKVKKAQDGVLEEIQQRIPVWTLFPEDIPFSKPLPESISRGNRQLR